MFPYWILFTVCAAGALEYRRRNRAFQGGPLLVAAALFAAILIGLRYRVGGDWSTYIEIFQYFKYGKLSEILFLSDPGYTLLNWLGHRVGADIWFVNLACALIFSWGLFRFAQAQPNPWLALVVAVPYLIIVVAMGYTRQAVAIGILLAALASFQHYGSVLRFAIYMVFAAAFHKSAIIILPFVALAVAQRNLLTTGAIGVFGAILFYIFLRSSVDQLMTAYIESGYESQGAAVRVAMNIIPALLYLGLQRRFGLPPVQARLWRYLAMMALASVLMLFVIASTTAVDRLALYLIPLQLFVLSRVPYAFPVDGKPNGQVALLVIAYSAMVQFVWLNYAANKSAWVPYQFYPTAEKDDL